MLLYSLIIIAFYFVFFDTQGKLIQLFGRQLAIKQRCNTSEKSVCNEEVQQFPYLKKWLHVVDIHDEPLQVGDYNHLKQMRACAQGCMQEGGDGRWQGEVQQFPYL